MTNEEIKKNLKRFDAHTGTGLQEPERATTAQKILIAVLLVANIIAVSGVIYLMMN